MITPRAGVGWRWVARAGGLMFMWGLAVMAVEAGGIDGIRAGLTPGNTRLVFDLDGPAEVERVPTPEPHLLVLDFPGVDAAPQLGAGPWPGEVVRDVYSQPLDGGGLRVLVALGRCVALTVFPLRPYGSSPDRLVVDLSDIPSSPQAGASATRVGPGCDAVPGPAESEEAAAAGAVPAAHTRAPVAAAPSAAKPPAGAAMAAAPRPTIEFSGTWEHEWAVAREGGNQKFESLLQPRFDLALSPEVALTAIARLRLDAEGELGPTADRPANYAELNGPWYNTEHAAFELRELYLDREFGDVFLRLGKQQVVWGEADGFKVLDVVNPQSFREFILDDFDESRIALWMLNLEWALGAEDTLQLLWIPDTTYHELAEPATPFAFTSPLLLPPTVFAPGAVIRDAERPDNPLEDGDAGARYRTLLGGWDISVNYLYGYGDFPVPFGETAGTGGGMGTVVTPKYRRHHLVGGTLGTTFGNVALRAEGAWDSDRWFPSTDPASGGVEQSEEFTSVVGLDWQPVSTSLVSTQWFYSLAPDHRPAMVRGQVEQMVSLLLQQQFYNESWQFRLLTLHSVDMQDAMYQMQLKHWLTSRLEIWVGVDLFSGDQRGLFGQFDDRDRALAGMRLGF